MLVETHSTIHWATSSLGNQGVLEVLNGRLAIVNAKMESPVRTSIELPMRKYEIIGRNGAAVWPFRSNVSGPRACRRLCQIEKRQSPAWEGEKKRTRDDEIAVLTA